MMKIEKGFTMIEVLMVMLVIGLLASLIIPRFFGQQERAVVAEAVSMLSAIRQGEAAYLLENSTYLAASGVTGWSSLGLDDPNNAQWTYVVDNVSATTFTATATRLSNGYQACVGKTITLTQAGVFGGTHLYGPTPTSILACN